LPSTFALKIGYTVPPVGLGSQENWIPECLILQKSVKEREVDGDCYGRYTIAPAHRDVSDTHACWAYTARQQIVVEVNYYSRDMLGVNLTRRPPPPPDNAVTRRVTQLLISQCCSASCVGCKRGSARIFCRAPRCDAAAVGSPVPPLSIDVFRPSGAQQQTRRKTRLRSQDGTDRQTEGRTTVS